MAKPYSQRSAGARKRIDARIRRDGLDRQRALRAIAAGRWTPFARTAERRTPPVRIASRPEPAKFKGGYKERGSDLAARVAAHKRLLFGDDIKFVGRNSDRAAKKYMAATTDANMLHVLQTDNREDLRDLAKLSDSHDPDNPWNFLFYH